MIQHFHRYGVDHYPAWHAWVASRTDPARAHLTCQPFDWPTERLAEFIPAVAHDAYIEAPLRLGGRFDVLIIDGRFRRRCVEPAMRVVTPGGLVLLCDAHRKYYHCTLKQYEGRFLDIGRWRGSIADLIFLGY